MTSLRGAWWAAVLAVAASSIGTALGLGAATASAQQPPGAFIGRAASPGLVGQPMMTGTPAGWYPPAYGMGPGYPVYPMGAGVTPAAFVQGAPPYAEVGPGVGREGAQPQVLPSAEALPQSYAESYAEDGGYIDPAFASFLSCFAWLLPYPGGGCCQPHWFDIEMEAVALKRDSVSDEFVFTSYGFTLDGPPDVALSSRHLDLDPEPGMRVTGVIQVGPGSDIEFTYLGLTQWQASASVEDPDSNLWSPFSKFGSDPVGVPFIAYDDVDHALSHTINFRSHMNTVEANYRRRFVGPTCCMQGSWLAGFRYLQLRDKLLWSTRAPENFDQDLNPAWMDYRVSTTNHMYGGQIGGDLWICVLPGLNVGMEGKGGIFGNDSRQETTILANSINPALSESEHKSEVATVMEFDFMVNYRLNPKFTIRGGYMILWAAGMALAAENVNATPPAAFNPEYDPVGRNARTVTIDTDGDALWHGWTLGAEYMW